MPVAAETARYMQYDWHYRSVDGEHIVRPGDADLAPVPPARALAPSSPGPS
jgi:hypothetical protein